LSSSIRRIDRRQFFPHNRKQTGQKKDIMRAPTYKPSKDATSRTKNRFKEHTLVVESFGGLKERTSTRVFGLAGIECILFESVERDTKHVNSPRWMGWIPASEVERTSK
jgi:hypothetical protein